MHFFPFVYIKVKYIGTTLLKKQQQNKHQQIPKNQEINLNMIYPSFNTSMRQLRLSRKGSECVIFKFSTLV